MSAAARFAAAYAALWAAHDVADHVVQTDHQAAGKGSRDGWARPLAGHVATYTATQALALAALRTLGVRPRAGRVLAALAWSAGTHAFLDRRWPVVELLRRTGSAGFAQPEIPGVLVDSISPSWIEHRRRLGGWPDRVHGGLTTKFPPVGITRNPTLPLHGPYLADQALHHVCVALAAAIIAGRHR